MFSWFCPTDCELRDRHCGFFFLSWVPRTRVHSQKRPVLFSRWIRKTSAVHWAPHTTQVLKTSKEIHPQVRHKVVLPFAHSIYLSVIIEMCSSQLLLHSRQKLAPFCQSKLKLGPLVGESHRVSIALLTLYNTEAWTRKSASLGSQTAGQVTSSFWASVKE